MEHRRTTGFLLGLLLALAIMVVALEYTSTPGEPEGDDGLLEDVERDMEMIPVITQKDMVAQTVAAPPKSEEASAKINPVDAKMAKEVPERLVQLQKSQMEGEGTEEATENEGDKTTALSPVALNEEDKPLHFRVVEQLPEFPGGMVEFMKWLTKNLRYPTIAQQREVEGKVVVSFIVNKDGTTSHIDILKSVDVELDREALRVIRIMPRWKPGENQGKPCRTMVAIPVVFKL